MQNDLLATPTQAPYRILVAPLDWGLGHATRCIPLIRELLDMGCKVYIGAGGPQAILLQETFPELTLLTLPGYGIRYPTHPACFGLKMIQQLPRIQKAIRMENHWLVHQVKDHQLQAVISDNRFGLYHPGIPSVIMTHQLRILSPIPGMESALQKVNYHYINRFGTCWIMDGEEEPNLAGALSHPLQMPQHAQYLGGLSRFHYREGVKSRYDVLVLISGPEPQRSIFEKMILAQATSLPYRMLIVSGKPGEKLDRHLRENIRQVSHLNASALNEAILESDLVLSRSGYTTIMDLVQLRRKAVLVPTPGQTEQEYLARYLGGKAYFLSLSQKTFHLGDALAQAAAFSFRLPKNISMDSYKKIVRDFVHAL